jgi:uncharacterized repeat protein (TIGR01451 family)
MGLTDPRQRAVRVRLCLASSIFHGRLQLLCKDEVVSGPPTGPCGLGRPRERARRRRLGRVAATLGVLAVAGGSSVGSTVSSAPGASAVPTACSAPTMILEGSGSVSLSSGDVASIPSGSSFTGGLNEFRSGAFVCVQPGGTFAPAWMNNPAGTLSNLGTVTSPSFVLAAGFVWDNEGTTTMGSLNVNGSVSITNTAGADFTISSSFAPSSGTAIDNAGTLRVQGNFNFNTGTILQNTGTVDIASGVTVDGVVENRGVVSAAGMNVNGGSNFFNGCELALRGDFNNNATAFTNSGLVETTGAMTNNNNYTQTPTGLTSGVNFTNNGSVTGFGELLFQGTTVTQNSFVGTSEHDPIVFDDRTPTGGQIFDVQSGQVVNVVAGAVSLPPGPTSPDCADGEAIANADVETTKVGPGTVAPGGTVAYRLTVANYGPDPAEDVVLTDRLPPELGSPDAVGGSVANGEAVWNVGIVAVGSTLTFDLSGIAPATGSLTDVVSSTSSTPDSDPTNNDGSSSAASVTTIVVEEPPPLEPPVIDDLTVFTVARVPVSGTVLASVPEGQNVVFSLVQGPANGSAFLSRSGAFIYTPTADFVGTDTFRTTGCLEDTDVCDSNTVTVEVYPLAREVASSTQIDTPVDIDVGSETIGSPTVMTVAQQPSNGTAVVQDGGVVTYTPVAGFEGDDTFTYQVCATGAPTLCASALVTVQVVAPPRQPPVLEDQSWTTTANQAVWGEITAGEADPGVTVTVTVQSPPLDGSVVQSGDIFTYTPNHEFTGIDSFVVEGCDDGVPPLCGQAIITVTVVPGPEPDSAVTVGGTPVTIDVKANDAGAESTGPPTTTTPPQNGTAQVVGNDSYLYTPNAGFDGTDTFGYQICSLAVSTLCGNTTVTVDVAPPPPPNEPPVVEDLTVQTSAGLPVGGTVPATDPEGDPLTFTVTTAPTQGTVDLASAGTFTYTPTGNTFAGIDTFVVTACDPSDACDSGTVTVRIRPIAQPIALVTEALAATGVDVFAHVNGSVGPPTITQPANGTATIVSAGNVEYLPTGSFTGQDPFDYTVCASGVPDGVEPLCDQSEILVDVYPIAIDNMVATTPNHPVTVSVALNDAGDALDATLIGAPTHGQMTNLGGNEVTYTPDGTWTGIEDMGYQRCSAGSVPLCARALIVITVVPRLHNDGAITHQGRPVTTDVYANDEGEAGLATIVSGPAAGHATVAGFTGVVYTPNADFTGIDTLIYLRCSPNAPSLCATATLAVLVLPAPPPVPPPAPPPPPRNEAKLALAVTGMDVPVLFVLSLVLVVLGLGLSLLAPACSLFGVKRRARHRARTRHLPGF